MNLPTRAGRLLVGQIDADGPQSLDQHVTAVSGGGLTWRLATRASSDGTSEIWQAWAPDALTDVRVTAALAVHPYGGSVSVTAWKGAAREIGATGQSSVTLSNAPDVSLSSRVCGSVFVGAGHDWSRAVAVTAPAGQTINHRFLDRASGDTYWTTVLDRTDVQPATLVRLRINDLGGSDSWSYVAPEIPPAG